MIAALLLLALSAEPELTPPPPPPDVGPPEAQKAIEEAFNEPVVEDPNLGALVRVELKGGQSLRGKLIAHTKKAVTLELPENGLEVVLATSAISEIAIPVVYFDHDGDPWYVDHNTSRYFFAHSAILMKRGTWYVSAKEVAGGLVGFGITDFLNVDVGTALPAFAAGFDGFNLLVGLRGGGQMLSWLHLSAGVQALALGLFTAGRASGIPVGGLISGTATFGDESTHLTFSSGMPFSFAGGAAIGPPLFTLAAFKRLGRVVGLMTEHWLYLDYGNPSASWILIDGFGVRLMGENLACDLGVGLTSNQSGFGKPLGFPFPLVDLTWNFY